MLKATVMLIGELFVKTVLDNTPTETRLVHKNTCPVISPRCFHPLDACTFYIAFSCGRGPVLRDTNERAKTRIIPLAW